jgi:hypothetical protein
VAQLGQQALAAELALQHVNQELQQLKADNQQLAGRLEVGQGVCGAAQHIITMDAMHVPALLAPQLI